MLSKTFCRLKKETKMIVSGHVIQGGDFDVVSIFFQVWQLISVNCNFKNNITSTMTSLKRSLHTDASATNITSKVYVRSTKSGKVQKIVRELYLRQDIPCSSQLCTLCSETAPRDASGFGEIFYQIYYHHFQTLLTYCVAAPNILSAKPAGTKSFPQGHYLVPDTNALLNALDVFEQTSAFYDVAHTTELLFERLGHFDHL